MMLPPVLRVALCDDDRMFRALLRMTLSSEDGIDVVGESCEGASCLDDVARTTPDVLVLDLEMPELTGQEVLARIADVSPDTRVMVVTAEEGSDVEPLVRSLGAVDFLSKGARDFIDVLPSRLRRAAAA